jgi:hypothetical protein
MLGVVDKFISNICCKSPPKISGFIGTIAITLLHLKPLLTRNVFMSTDKKSFHIYSYMKNQHGFNEKQDQIRPVLNQNLQKRICHLFSLQETGDKCSII